MLDYRGHTIHLPIEEVLPQTATGPTPFWNPASKVARLQAYTNTPEILEKNSFLNIDFQSHEFSYLSSAYFVLHIDCVSRVSIDY